MRRWIIERKIPVVVILTLLSSAIMGIAYAAYFKADIEHVKEAIAEYKGMPERMARIEQRTDDIYYMMKDLYQGARK